MRAYVVDALEESLRHWRQIVRFIRDYQGKKYTIRDYELSVFAVTPTVSLGRESCALCMRFNKDGTKEHKKCNGCPVKIKAKEIYCNDTPYYPVLNTLKRDSTNELNKDHLQLARKELSFLKSLRDRK